MVTIIHRVREMIKMVDEKLEALCSPFPEYACLLSIPGFGPEVSATVMGAIGDPYRFSCGRQVLKMAGFICRRVEVVRMPQTLCRLFPREAR